MRAKILIAYYLLDFNMKQNILHVNKTHPFHAHYVTPEAHVM